MSNEVEYEDIIAFHPGSYIEDIINDLNITQNEFAERIGVSSKTISKIINGEDRITSVTANKLDKATGVSYKTWNRLQSIYDEKILEIKDRKKYDEEKRVCSLIDMGTLKDNNFVNNKKRYKVSEKITEIRRKLILSDLTKLYDFNSLVSYRKSDSLTNKKKSIVNSNVMLEFASNEARNKTDTRYSKAKLRQALPKIKGLIIEPNESFYLKLKDILLKCGIVLIAMPSLKGAGLNGATKKFKNGSVLLLITDRKKTSDIFWFSLAHELGHIIYEDFSSNTTDKIEYENQERKADDFASNFLIPNTEYNSFIETNLFNEHSIKEFSEREKVLPGIVVGRLQKDNKIKYDKFNYLKTKYYIHGY
ncbi:HigA family addiction module antitoxin [Nicoliella spurrieriana]|uniref:HigA family addiction module antitoxin n=1 Tax=Nicoliella spurrieriana TaxID=2925830 RepID=A0A976RSM4_9LACO|nr:HigA family addiction module antitoxin [Nicoliella spurrieriana]UQS86856.1 HigA family addiction module antitoxin [Nicoliella spurrieriana]